MKKVIAIDFDGTITEDSPFPIIGAVRPEAIKYIKLLDELGYTLILWTNRFGKFLEEALLSLTFSGISDCFSFINEPDDRHLNIKSRKIYADFYIDDKSCLGEVDWEKIFNYIVKNIQ